VATITTEFVDGGYLKITWTGMPGNATDWVSIAPAVSADSTYYGWRYMVGVTDGSFLFVLPNPPNVTTPVTAGSYVVRAFINDTLVKAAESAPFTVTDITNLPTLTKTWLISDDLANATIGSYAGYPELFILIKNQLKTYGWVVDGSANGVVANSSDNINSASDIPVTGAPNQPWIIFRNPTTGVSMLWVFNDFGRVTWSWSPAGRYTGGTVSSSPTAADQQTIAGAAFWASDQAGWSGTNFPELHARVFASDDGMITRMIIYDAAGLCKSVMMVEELARSQNDNPFVVTFIPDQGNSGPTLSFFSFNRFADANAVTGGQPVDVIASTDARVLGAQLVSEAVAGPGGYPLTPMGMIAIENNGSTFVGWIGNLIDTWLSTGLANLAVGSTFPSTGDSQFIKFGDLVWPWDGSVYPHLTVNPVDGNTTWNIGFTGPTTPTIHTTSVTAFADHLEVQFSDDVVLSGPALDVASWFVTLDGPGRTVQVGSVSFVGNTVTLGVTPQTLDATYTLHLPQLGISSPSFGIFTGAYSLDFAGVVTPVSVQMIRAVDAHHIDVIFSIAVDETTASDPANYALNNGLTVTAATKMTDLWYKLTNQPRQVDGTNYTLVVSNVEPK
jgi:hypothetical protein